VYVLERTREAGKKVLMSGGTRCNVLPGDVDLQVRAWLWRWQLGAFSGWHLAAMHKPAGSNAPAVPA
jgi:hypothetical protein